jgi:hypothetical protein
MPRADEQRVRKSGTVDGVAGRQTKDPTGRALAVVGAYPSTTSGFDVYAGTTYSPSVVNTNNTCSPRYAVVAKPVTVGSSTATLWTYDSSAGHCKAAAFFLERASSAPLRVSSKA